MNLFLVSFAVQLGLKALATSFPGVSWLFGGFFGSILAYFGEKYLNFMVTRGILHIDLGKYAIDVGLEQHEYRKLIMEAYKRATEKVYTEEEKVAIRKQYLDAIRKFVRVGDGVRTGDKNP
jgi:hypothetical protein